VAVLYDGMLYADMGFNPEQSQFIETLEMVAKQVAACYGVPLPFIGINDKTASFASSEQVDIQFGKHTVRPLSSNMEQAFNKALFATEPNVYCEMDLDALLRGDAVSQADWYSKTTSNGLLTSDEVRKKLNLPAQGGPADRLRVQSNMVLLEDLPKLSQAAAANPGQAAGDTRK
jgi:HK97 family phage portal protein